MENQQKNEETKSNGIILLENVIKSNERTVASNEENIEQCVKVQFDIEDLISSFKHMQTELQEVKEKYNEEVKFYKIEQEKRAEFLAKIPTKTETVLSQETIDFYENLEKRMKRKDKNPNTERIYKAGYKLSEISNKLKMKDIKAILNENKEKKLDDETIFSENSNEVNNGNELKSISIISEVGKAIEQFLQPTYTAADDEFLKKKKRKSR